jgi:hypothetical protein
VTNTLTRTTPAPATTAEDVAIVMPEPELDPRAPYLALANAEHAARERFPEAIACRAVWTPANSAGEVHVEVWAIDEATGREAARMWRP